MKAGIITFHRSYNNGSMLQAYALQEVLKSRFAIDVEIIDYSSPRQQNMYALFRKVHTVKDFIFNAIKLAKLDIFQMHHEYFTEFLYRYLELSQARFSELEEMKEIERGYDIVIAGSDQIWNVRCPDFTTAYLLSFIKHKPKIAYAVSLGVTDIRREQKCGEYSGLIRDFNLISVRENNGADWITEITGQTVEVLVDPTLLLTKQDYLKLSGDKKIIEGDYIFYYCFRYTKEQNKFVTAVSRKYSLPVIVLDAKAYYREPSMWGYELTAFGGPLNFIDLVHNAKLILTSSFHGVAFSIIFRKNFWFLHGTTHNEKDDRTKTLMDTFEISERVIKLPQEDVEGLMSDVVYLNAHKIVESERRKSFAFLEEAIRRYSVTDISLKE